MLKAKKILLVAGIASILGTSATALASNEHMSANISHNLRNETVNEVNKDKPCDEHNDKCPKKFKNSEEFRTKILERKKKMLQEKVKEGVITQEKADEILKSIQERLENMELKENK